MIKSLTELTIKEVDSLCKELSIILNSSGNKKKPEFGNAPEKLAEILGIERDSARCLLTRLAQGAAKIYSTNRQTKYELIRISAALYSKGTREDAPIIRKFKESYLEGSFNYPPTQNDINLLKSRYQ